MSTSPDCVGDNTTSQYESMHAYSMHTTVSILLLEYYSSSIDTVQIDVQILDRICGIASSVLL